VTHWLRGIGIIVLALAIRPLLGISGMQLFKAEAAGPAKDKLAPRVAETARLLRGSISSREDVRDPHRRE
jgi:trk system potassium uptake protein TrkH